jgi:hypothetical protein
MTTLVAIADADQYTDRLSSDSSFIAFSLWMLRIMASVQESPVEFCRKGDYALFGLGFLCCEEGIEKPKNRLAVDPAGAKNHAASRPLSGGMAMLAAAGVTG